MSSRLSAARVECEWQTAPDSAVRSVQRVALATSDVAFAYWGQPRLLERLLRRYFEIAERRVAHLVRVRWENGGPVIRVRWLGVPLIVMGAARLELSGSQRGIRVPILGGLVSLAAPGAELRIILAHTSPEMCALVELDGYRPRAGRVGLVRWIYRQTQARLHVHVGRPFLGELAQRWQAAPEQPG